MQGPAAAREDQTILSSSSGISDASPHGRKKKYISNMRLKHLPYTNDKNSAVTGTLDEGYQGNDTDDEMVYFKLNLDTSLILFKFFVLLINLIVFLLEISFLAHTES